MPLEPLVCARCHESGGEIMNMHCIIINSANGTSTTKNGLLCRKCYRKEYDIKKGDIVSETKQE